MTAVLARAPGRVNIIGEHTDYNGGFVFPCAIGAATTVHYAPASVQTLSVRTAFGTHDFAIDVPREEPYGDWRDYARGVLSEVAAANVTLEGGAMDVTSTVAFGAGLSSSASFEVALTLALLYAARASLDRLQIALLAQRAENGYTGTRSGIMDQFAVLFGERGKALLLDTRSLTCEAVAVPEHLALIVCNTMQRHELGRGEYNVRRAQCEEAVQVLRARRPEVKQLRDVQASELTDAQALLTPLLFRRARHVVSENARVLQAAEALRANDAARVGELMNASHKSLRDDYEVSSERLDLLAQIARDCGAYGARMTGGGFGGCIVALVERDRAEEFSRAVARRYFEQTGVAPEIYDGTPSEGASVAYA